jgi:hypothetical protein
MAIDAVVLVPDVLAVGDSGRNLVCVGELRKLAVAVDSEHQEDQRGDRRTCDREVPCLTIVHTAWPAQTPMPDQ